MSSFASICKTLESNLENGTSFDKILIDFLLLITAEKVDICKYARDPYLHQFTNLALQPFLRLNAHSGRQARTNILEIIRFFNQLFLIHPAFLDCAATILSVDSVLQTTLLIDDNEFRRGVVGFIANLTTSPTCIVTTSAGSKLISECLLSMFTIPVLSGYAIVIFAGLIRFSPIFATTIKSSAELRNYRDVLSNALSSDDHICVIASISALLSLFPRSVDLETAKVAALHAINVSNDNILLLKAAAWIFVEVARENAITAQSIHSLLKLATSNVGLKAFCLFETINCILANGGINALDIQKDIHIQKLIKFILAQKLGYVAYSVIKLVQQLFERNETLFDQLQNCESIAIKALEIASAPSLTVDIDLIECAIVLLRFIAKSPTCFQTIQAILKANEENAFVAFQRSIESNRSYTSLEFFLFLADVSKTFLDWNKRLRLIVIDSQFGALLAHVLEKSTDRQTICDGIKAISIISNFSQEANVNDGELLFDSIVSGFAIINSQNQKDIKIYRTATSDQIAKNEEDIYALRSQVEMNELEMETLKTKTQSAYDKCQEMEYKNLDLIKQNSALKEQVDKLQDQLQEKEKDFQDLTQKYNDLEKANNDKKIILDKNADKIALMNKQIERFNEIEKEKSRIDRDNATYQQKLDGLQSTIDQLNEQVKALDNSVTSYKNKLKESKMQLTNQALTVQKAESEREKMSIQLNSLQEKFDTIEKIREAEKEKYQLIKQKLRESNQVAESLRTQTNELKIQLDTMEQKNNELNSNLNALLTERKQWELITQFVHRITDDTPVPSEQLMTLFKDV